MFGASVLQRFGGICQERLRQQIAGVGTHNRHFLAVAWREEIHRDVHLLQQISQLIFHHIGQCAHDHQLWFVL